MTEQQRELLMTIRRLEEEHRRTKCPDPVGGVGRGRAAQGGAILDWEQQKRHGPRIAALSPPGADNTERKRLSRALVALENLGLAQRWAAWGANATHVQLTAAGVKALVEQGMNNVAIAKELG